MIDFGESSGKVDKSNTIGLMAIFHSLSIESDEVLLLIKNEILPLNLRLSYPLFHLFLSYIYIYIYIYCNICDTRFQGFMHSSGRVKG